MDDDDDDEEDEDEDLAAPGQLFGAEAISPLEAALASGHSYNLEIAQSPSRAQTPLNGLSSPARSSFSYSPVVTDRYKGLTDSPSQVRPGSYAATLTKNIFAVAECLKNANDLTAAEYQEEASHRASQR